MQEGGLILKPVNRSLPVSARRNDWGSESADNIRIGGLYSPHKQGRRRNRTHDQRNSEKSP
jgi:hypothetical protein